MFEMNNYRLFTVRYFFGKIVDIEPFALRAAILDEFEIYLGGGGGQFGWRREIFFLPSSSHRLYTPDARPLGTYETKMATLTGKRSILTILRKNTGQLTV